MRVMKESMKCFIALFVMVMVFVVTGITAQAAAPINVTNWRQLPPPQYYTVDFEANQTSAQGVTFTIPGKGVAVVSVQSDISAEMILNDTDIYVSPSGGFTEKPVYFSAGGNYTLTITRDSDKAESAGTIKYCVYFYNSADASIKAKQVTSYYSQSDKEYSYTKITVPATGYIRVDTPGDYFDVYVSLLNSKKQVLTGDEIETDTERKPTVYFGVKKGTYYIRTRSKASGIYSVKYSFTKVKEKSGAKKSKAVEIKKGKTVKGVLIANGKLQSDWYKVTLKKKEVLKLAVKTYNSGNIKLKIIPANTKVNIIGDTARFTSSSKTQSIKTRDKFYAGTYYLQVTTDSEDLSGYYEIKFK